jgi:NAD(P)-dependent dehydrogenase (short-subunit alcohol dehydrogenase family)
MKKIALITGSTSGIGLGIAEGLLSNKLSIKVIISGTQDSVVEDKVNYLKNKYGDDNVTGYELNISDEDSIEACFKKIESDFGRLDYLFNNAGVNFSQDESEASIMSINKKVLEKTLLVNTIGPILVAKRAVNLLKKSNDARIINTSSEMASLSLIKDDYYPLMPSYRISKVALNAITVLLAKELEEFNITVNAYSPGWTKTKIGGDDAPFTVEEATETAIYLATDQNFRPNGEFFAEVRKFGGPIKINW